LGAGRLLDVDLPRLIPLFDEIHLFDADPSVIRTWREASGVFFRDTVVPRVMDVTGSLRLWSDGLRRACRGGSLAEYLRSLEVTPAGWEDERFDGVISLNLLGQIPIYWRDRVADEARDLTEEELSELAGSMERLQVAHLESIRRGARSWSIVISDTEYYTYTMDTSEWEIEPALHGSVERALQDSASFGSSRGSGAWLWHLAPQGIEEREHGSIHRVEARAFGAI
jgi:hypothetical protein